MRLRVASLNVWALPWGLAPDEAERMQAIAQHLPSLDADIVGLQEVWTAAARDTLIEGGRRAGFENIWHRPMAYGGSGLVVLSKLPILESQFTPFSVRGRPERLDHSDYHGGKGFIRLRLATSSGPIQLINTHLHARYSGSLQTDAYLEVRSAQTVEIALALADLHEPVIALGDFNLREGQPEYRILLGLTGLRDAAASIDHRQPTITADNPYRARPTKVSEDRIDYIFTRGGRARAVDVIGAERSFDAILDFAGRKATYSDHAGVSALLAIHGEPALPHPQDPRAHAEARQILARGLDANERRGRDQRITAIAGMASGIGLWSLSNRVTRRAWLRHCLRAAALTSTAAASGFGWLGLGPTPEESTAYENLLRDLETRASRTPDAGTRVLLAPAGFADRDGPRSPTASQTSHPRTPFVPKRA